MIKNFTEVKPLRYWVQHILPLVYDDSLSYMELLGKVVSTLNEIVKNNNVLPDYVMELIKDYISSGEIEKVLAEVLANYMLNVKFPPAGLTPATGDGSADDTEAIQGCIDYAFNHGGMAVYFPSGKYLTQPLTLKNKATLFGQDRYSTVLVMKGGATKAMFTGDVDELTLTGLGFDGNMDIQVNNVNLFTISVNSAIITNCLLTDGYDLLNITVNDDLQLNDVIFKHAVENALVLKGTGTVQGHNLIFKSVSALVGKNFVVMDVSKSILEQLKCYGASPNAVLINGNNNVVRMWNEQSLKAYTDNGNNNTIEVYTQSEQKKLTGSKTTNVSGDITETVGRNKTESITGNKDVSVHNLNETVAENYTKTVTGSISESANSFKTVIRLAYNLSANSLTERLTNKEVNATNSTENLSNKTETITGEKEVTANTSTENIANEKHVIAGTVTEDITSNKHVNAANIIETVQAGKTITANNISETAVNKTVHITENSTEQTDGTRTLTVAGANNETTGARTETVNGNKTEDITGDKHVNAANEIHSANIFDIQNTLKYKTPTNGEKYNVVPLLDRDNQSYNVMVENENTKNLGTSQKLCVVAIGDSYALGGDNYGNWIDPFRTALGLTNNVDFYSKADGGAGFSQNGSNTDLNFEGLLENLSNSIQDKGSVTKVLCAGGYNDDNVKTENVKSFVNKSKFLFPNAEVYIACIARSTDMSKNLRIANDILPTYQIGANIAGAIYITNSESCNHDYSQMGDSIHPNQTLSNYIGRCLAQGIKTGSCDVNSSLSQINFRPINNTLQMGAWYEKLHNNNVIIIGSVIYFGQNEPIQPNANIEIAEVDSKYLLGITGINLIYFNIPGYFSDGANHFWNGSACFGIRDKKLILKSFTINRDGSAFEPTLKQFTGEFGTIILDSIYC